MASCKLHTVLNKLQKQVNCIFFLNQILATNNVVTTQTLPPFYRFVSSSSASTSTLHSKLKTHPSPQKHPLHHIHQTGGSTFNSTKVRTLFTQSNTIAQRALGNSAHTLTTAARTENLNRDFHLDVRKMSTETGNHNSNSKVDSAASHMVWVDCEMTGLDPRKDCILEIACLITDTELKVIDTIELVIKRTEDILKHMNEWCVVHHTASGLVDRVRQSSTDIAEADNRLLEFVSKHLPPGTAPMIGNSVYMDRMFILNELPKFNHYLHYRIIDISSLKELCKVYNGDLYQKVPKKRLKHRGLNDIEDTLEEFRFYRQHFLKTDSNASDEHPSAVPYC
uniref:Probable oligoribonuclease n=2 Tax=Cacopsylla melanoneura TaxID=428564 RepID=A0A8D8Y0Y2_9HEMI